MSILFGGGEFDAFLITGTNWAFSTSNGTTWYDSNYSRGAMYGVHSDWLTPNFDTDYAEAWAHVRMYPDGNVFSATDIIEFRNVSNQGVLRLRLSSSLTLQLQYWNGATWTNIGATYVYAADAVYVFDVHCKIANTGGLFEFYVNGVLHSSISGDTDVFIGSAIRNCKFNTLSNVNGGVNTCYMSEIIVCTDDTRSMRLATLAPNGAGTIDQWVGAYTDVNEIGTYNDASYISSGTAAQVELFTLTDLSATAQTLDVVGVTLTGRGRRGATGPQNLQAALYTGGAQFNTGSLPNVGLSFATLQQGIWDLNPDTGLAWTIAEVLALEAGYESIT